MTGTVDSAMLSDAWQGVLGATLHRADSDGVGPWGHLHALHDGKFCVPLDARNATLYW